jgi:Tfp pilus assembly protein PilE
MKELHLKFQAFAGDFIRKLHLRLKGFTLVEIMIIVSIISLLGAIAIPNFLRARMSANDALAKATLRSISTASESYVAANNGNYPSDETSLTAATPAYLNKPYCESTISGYVFACNFTTASYLFTATPVAIGSSGTTTYTMSTGGLLTP